MKMSLIAVAFLASLSAFASKSYQVTGVVTDVTTTEITVQKGKENFEISKEPTTKGAADVKKGDKVTVYYTMAAKEVEAKHAKEAKKK